MVSRIDIGPDGGPYVAINENNNDLELQDINGNVIAKWDETAGQWDLNNNSLTNINSIDASSANVNQLQINDPLFPSEDARRLVKHIRLDGVQTISETVDFGGLTDNSYLIIEVTHYEDDEDGVNNSLDLTVSDKPNGGYDYLTKDDQGATTRVSSDDQYRLIEPTASKNVDRHMWMGTIARDGRNNPYGWGRGAASVYSEGTWVNTILGGPGGSLGTSLTFNASASGDFLTLVATVWIVQKRGDI